MNNNFNSHSFGMVSAVKNVIQERQAGLPGNGRERDSHWEMDPEIGVNPQRSQGLSLGLNVVNIIEIL